MAPQKKFHLVFSLFFFLAPVARKLTGKLLGMPT
jgi:hypothetical protein